MFNKLRHFLRYLLNKLRKQKCPSHVILRNNLPEDKKKYIIGTINLGYCGGHDCIIAKFHFEGFYETDIRLFWRNYWFDD